MWQPLSRSASHRIGLPVYQTYTHSFRDNVIGYIQECSQPGKVRDHHPSQSWAVVLEDTVPLPKISFSARQVSCIIPWSQGCSTVFLGLSCICVISNNPQHVWLPSSFVIEPRKRYKPDAKIFESWKEIPQNHALQVLHRTEINISCNW